ncbi:hypothetical protein DYE49_03890 [Treponema rectale]|uniref:Uncharacterized protein n=1 Tax=Treponema rectale TaxID=744512 RepID=A0A7M1XJ26_9SPIR|nr:hypothetical protein DYE49_03890 [Treponema rectale]
MPNEWISKKCADYNYRLIGALLIPDYVKDIAKVIVLRQGKSVSGLLTLFMKGTQIKMNFIRNNLFAKEDIVLV